MTLRSFTTCFFMLVTFCGLVFSAENPLLAWREKQNSLWKRCWFYRGGLDRGRLLRSKHALPLLVHRWVLLRVLPRCRKLTPPTHTQQRKQKNRMLHLCGITSAPPARQMWFLVTWWSQKCLSAIKVWRKETQAFCLRCCRLTSVQKEQELV